MRHHSCKSMKLIKSNAVAFEPTYIGNACVGAHFCVMRTGLVGECALAEKPRQPAARVPFAPSLARPAMGFSAKLSGFDMPTQYLLRRRLSTPFKCDLASPLPRRSTLPKYAVLHAAAHLIAASFSTMESEPSKRSIAFPQRRTA